MGKRAGLFFGSVKAGMDDAKEKRDEKKAEQKRVHDEIEKKAESHHNSSS